MHKTQNSKNRERWYCFSSTSPVSTCCSSNITLHDFGVKNSKRGIPYPQKFGFWKLISSILSDVEYSLNSPENCFCGMAIVNWRQSSIQRSIDTSLDHWSGCWQPTEIGQCVDTCTSCRPLADLHLAIEHFQWLPHAPGTTFPLVSGLRIHSQSSVSSWRRFFFTHAMAYTDSLRYRFRLIVIVQCPCNSLTVTASL